MASLIEIKNTFQTFFSFPLKEDLIEVLRLQVNYLKVISIKYQLISSDNNFNINEETDLVKICQYLEYTMWRPGDIILKNQEMIMKKKDVYSFSAIADFLNHNKSIETSLVENNQEQSKDQSKKEFKMFKSRLLSIPRIATNIRLLRNLLEHQNEYITSSYYYVLLGQLKLLVENAYVGAKPKNINLDKIDESLLKFEKQIFSHWQSSNESEEVIIDQDLQHKKKEVKEILSKKDLALDYKINDSFKEIKDNLNEEFLKLEKKYLNLEEHIANKNNVTMLAIDDLKKNIEKKIESISFTMLKQNEVKIEEKLDEKVKVIENEEAIKSTNQQKKEEVLGTDYTGEPILTINNDDIFLDDEVHDENIASDYDIITRKQAYYELVNLRDKIKDDYKKSNKELSPWQNILQIPIIEKLLYEKDITSKEDWIKNTNSIKRLENKKNIWISRYEEHKEIMDNQIEKYWKDLEIILKRIEDYNY